MCRTRELTHAQDQRLGSELPALADHVFAVCIHSAVPTRMLCRTCLPRPSSRASINDCSRCPCGCCPQARRAQEGSRTPSAAISVFKKRVCRNHHVCPRSQRHTSDSDVRFGGCGSSLQSAPGVPGRPGERGLRAHVLRSRRTCATPARAHRVPWMSVLFTQLTRRVEHQPLDWGHRGHS